MRTVFTYALAIAASTGLATLPVLLIGTAVYMEGAALRGEIPPLAALWWALTQVWWLSLIFAAALTAFAVPAWMAWARYSAWRSLGRASMLFGGPIVGLAVAALALLARASLWFGDFRHNPLGESGFYLGGGAVVGAVWGIVFWIRAPEPTTAGIAA